MKTFPGFNALTAVLFLGFMLPTEVICQEAFDGFSYQAILRDDQGVPMRNSELDLIVGLYDNASGNNALLEESHKITTDGKGWFHIVIGKGDDTNNGQFEQLTEIDWSSGEHFVKVSVILGGGSGNITEFEYRQLFAVPYALYAKNSGGTFSIASLEDVDLTGLSKDDVLFWNGNKWQAGKVDSVGFSDNALTAVYADSALFVENVWKIDGNEELNSNEHFFGTIDDSDVVIKTGGEERMRIKGDGKIGIGTDQPLVGLHVLNNDGFLLSGEHGQGIIPASGPGSRMMWYPKKSAFRVGNITGDQWDDAQIGNYSFAGGLNTKASGDFSISFGEACISSGRASSSFGFGSTSSGHAAFAAGSQSNSSGFASIAMGRGAIASDSASIALGYHTRARGKASIAFGYQSEANADYSFSSGTRAIVNHSGTFMFTDRASFTPVNSTAENQFLVRASGGVQFFSDKSMTTGVFLEPGGGAWNTVSDRNLKENIEKVNYLNILEGIRKIPVTTWNYKTQNDSIRHIGPMAQDFYKEFGLGYDETKINSIDIDGINMAALKELDRLTKELYSKAEKIDKLESQMTNLNSEKDQLISKVEKMESDIQNLLELVKSKKDLSEESSKIITTER